MYIRNIFNNGTFDMNTIIKYTVILIHTKQSKIENTPFFLVYGILKY